MLGCLSELANDNNIIDQTQKVMHCYVIIVVT